MPISSISINLGSTVVSLLFSTRNNLPKCSTVCCWKKGIQNRIYTGIAIGQTLCKYLKCKWKFTLIWVDIPGFLKKGIFFILQKTFCIWDGNFFIMLWWFCKNQNSWFYHILKVSWDLACICAPPERSCQNLNFCFLCTVIRTEKPAV